MQSEDVALGCDEIVEINEYSQIAHTTNETPDINSDFSKTLKLE